MMLVEYLDPGDRLNEILFGVIMILTFTLGAGFAVEEGEAGVRELLIAALGCNTAWGLIDGVLYVTSRLLERGRRRRLIQAVQAAPDRASALEIVRREVEPMVVEVTSPEGRAQLYADVSARVSALPDEGAGLRREDLLGGLASFWLVFLSTLPAVLPFFFLSDPHRALRLSNALLILLLFAIGYRWASASNGSRVGTGLSLMSIGVVLVGIAIALGG
jgi:VIT1/CCC1 family predicted Fe2+/Mn2+ transporter